MNVNIVTEKDLCIHQGNGKYQVFCFHPSYLGKHRYKNHQPSYGVKQSLLLTKEAIQTLKFY